MSNPIAEALIRLRAEGDQFESETTGIFKKVAGAATLLFAGVKVAGFMKDAMEEARESQKVLAQTAAVLKSTGGAAKVSAKDVDSLADAISRKVGIDDEAIAKGENLLLTFTNVRNEVGAGNDVFNQATQVMVDMGAAMGTDASGSAIQLGKALNDPVKGITALTRVGVTFTEQQKDQIKAMVAAGDTLGAQKIILAELNKEFGGSAEAQATAADKMSTAWANFKEDVGTKMIPAVDTVENAITNRVLPAAGKLLDFLTGPFASSVGRGFGILGGAAEAVVGKVRGAASTMRDVLAPALDRLDGKGDMLAGLFPPEFRDFVDNHSGDIAAVAAAMATLGGAALVAAPAAAAVGVPVQALGSSLTTVVGPLASVAGALFSLLPTLTVAGALTLAVVVAVLAIAAALVYAYLKVKPFHDAVDAVVGLLRDGLIAAVDWITDTAFPAMGKAWDAVSGALGTAGRVVAGAFRTAVDAVTGFISGMDFLWDHVVPLLESIGGLFLAIATRVKEAFDATVAIISAAITVIQAVLDPFISALGTAFDIALIMLETAWSLFWDTITAALSIAASILEPIWSALWGGLMTLLQTTWNLMYGIVSAALDIIRGVIDTVTAIINGDWTGAWNGIKLIFSGIWDAMVAILNAAWLLIEGAITTSLALITGLWSGGWEAIRTLLNTVWEEIKTIVSGAMSIVSTAVTGALNTIDTAWRTIWGGIKDFISNDIVSPIQTVIDGLVTFFSDLPGRIATAVTGLWDPISDAFNKVIGFIKGVWNDFVDVWDAIKIHVPGIDIPLFGKVGDFDVGLPTLHRFLRLGGIVPGTGPMPAIVHGGEMVLTDSDQRALLSFIRGGAGGGSGSTVDARLIVEGNVYGDSHLESLLDAHTDKVAEATRVNNLSGMRAA